jgi:hypothetical protein
MLLALLDVVRTHYFLPRPPQMDPVVTSNDAMLRFEGFSGCCGVYVRVDLDTAGLQAERLGRGTTNVDFNLPMRAALMRLQDRERVEFSVGREAFTLSHGRTRRREEGQPAAALDQGLQRGAGLPAAAAADGRRERRRGAPLRAEPAVGQRSPATVVRRPVGSGAASQPATGRGRGRGQRPAASAYACPDWRSAPNGCASGATRLPALRRGKSSSGRAGDAAGQPGNAARFLGRRPGVVDAGLRAWQKALPRVRAQLRWQNEIDVGEVAQATGLTVGEVEAALAALGARGLAGYDCGTGRYFHRELPFDLERVEAMQPRLLDARQLLAENKVRLLAAGDAGSHDFAVDGSDVVHHVRLRADRDRCSCPWFSKLQGERGPCKHILAARLLRDGDAPPAPAGTNGRFRVSDEREGLRRSGRPPVACGGRRNPARLPLEERRALAPIAADLWKEIDGGRVMNEWLDCFPGRRRRAPEASGAAGASSTRSSLASSRCARSTRPSACTGWVSATRTYCCGGCLRRVTRAGATPGCAIACGASSREFGWSFVRGLVRDGLCAARTRATRCAATCG